MKKALSLILAVVMVALMIPFAALTSVAAADGDVLYSVDFTTAEPNAVTAVGEQLTLPEKWVDSKEADATLLSSVSSLGVHLAGAGEGIAMTEVPAAVQSAGAHVIEIKWNTAKTSTLNQSMHSFRIGFTTDKDTEPESVTSGSGAFLWTADQLMFSYLSGPGYGTGTNGYMNAGVDKYYYGGNIGWATAANGYAAQWATSKFTPTSDIYNKNGAQVSPLIARMGLSGYGTAGADFTTYVVVNENDFVEKVYMEAGDVRFEYRAPEGVSVSADGRLVLWHTNAGTGKSMYIKSVKYIDNTNGTYQLPAVADNEPSVIHSYNFSDATDLSDIPYTIYNGAQAQFSLEGGYLRMKTDGKLSSTARVYHKDTALIIGNEYLPDDGSYTLEYVLDGASSTEYFFNTFNISGVTDGTVAYTETLNLKFWNSDVGGNGNVLQMQSGLANLYGYLSSTSANCSAAVRDGRIEADLKIQLMVYDNRLVGGIVSAVTKDGTVIATDYYAHTSTRAQVAGSDIGFLMSSAKAYGSDVGFKSITILDEPLYEVDTNSYETTNNHVVKLTTSGDDQIVEVAEIEDVEIEAKGAGLRVEGGENGIRFVSKIDEAGLQAIVDLQDAAFIAKVECGTLITTDKWAEAAGGVTHEALDGIRGDRIAYIEVMSPVNEWYKDEANTFAGTVSALKEGRVYEAVGFVRVTDTAGNVFVYYSATTTASLESVTA